MADHHWAKDLLNQWEAKRLLPVGPDSSISPDKRITRGEFISIVNNAFNFPGKRYDWFMDVPDHAWYREDAAIAAAAGYITGYQNAQGEYEVRAEQPLSRQEAAAILSRVFNFQGGDPETIKAFADWQSIAAYAAGNIAYLVQAGYLSGYPDHTIRPLSNVTLAEAVTMVNSIAGEIINAKGIYQGVHDGNLLVNTSGITLKDVLVKGDLFLTQGIGSGNILLDHVEVIGNTYVYGNNAENIDMQNSNVQDKLIVLNLQPEWEENAVASEISSFSINGYSAILTDDANQINILVNKNDDMDNLQVDFTTTESDSKLMMGTKELKSGGKFKFERMQDLVLLSKNDRKKQYRLAIFAVDRVVNTGLPTLVIQTADNAPVVDKVNKIPASMAILDGSAVQYGKGLHQGALTIKGRGNSSWWVEKKAYKLSTDTDAQLLDLPEEEDWVLVPNYSDKTLMRNYIAYRLGVSMNMPFSPKMRFVEFYLNGEFLGNYLLGEKIGISKNRVNIHKLKNTENADSAVTGGYLIEKNWLDRLDPDEIYFQTEKIKDNDVFNVKGPSASKITLEQMAYLSDYFQQAEDALSRMSFSKT